jgi:CubicO group peptidase (beta-lactamase class C family)/peptidoglycan/LPS O-acetylase OafA/YrhL
MTNVSRSAGAERALAFSPIEYPTRGTASPTVVPAVAAPQGTSPGSGEREVFLDAIRAIAIVRVMAWHAFGVATITYVVAAMPAMFFVTGSLLAKSMNRRPARTVLADRFRRLLIPLWAFAAVAWLAMAVAASRMDTGLPLHRALAWFFPFTDPHGSPWEGGWLSSHLWYLRTLVWLLLASPLLLRAVRALGGFAVLVPVAGVFALDVLSRPGGVLTTNRALIWAAGDLILYSVFLMAGFLHRRGGFHTVSRRGWTVLALIAAAAATGWRLTQPVPLGVVNNSHPMHLFVGAAWLALALAGRDLLTRVATTHLAGPVIRAIGRRSLTIYLWHTAAIIVALNILDARRVDGPIARPVGLVLLTALGTLVAVQVFGWIEDLAARRPLGRPATGPARRFGRPAVALATVVAFAGVVLITPVDHRGQASEEAAAASPHRPPVPSQPPPPPTFTTTSDAPPVSAEPASAAVEPAPELAGRLERLVAQWAEETGVGGALVGIDGQGVRWTGAVGSRPDTGQPMAVPDRIELASLTKLFTAALVYRFVQDGRIVLDEPLPLIRSLPDFPYDYAITVEQLLDHTSGLINYLDTDLYAFDPERIDNPAAAVMASVAHPLAADPGAAYLYSSTNFLVLGLLLEEVSGQSFDDLLHQTLLMPLGLRDTVHLPAAPGWPRGATSGIESNLADLLTAGRAILRDHVGLSDDTFSQMTDVDVSYGFGPGTFGFCPCRVDDTGTPHFFAIGYYGATTLLAFAKTLDLTIAVDLVDSLGVNGGYAAVERLYEMLDALARSS